MVIAVVSAAAGHIAFRQSVDEYHRLAETILPAQITVSQLVDLSRMLGDQPLAYAFAASDDERLAEAAEFRQTADDLLRQLDLYTASGLRENADQLQATAHMLIDRGEEFMRLVDQGAPNLDLQTAKVSTETAEDEFQDLLGDATVSLQAELAHTVVADSGDTVTAWTIFSIAASILTTIVASYVLLKLITQPIEQLEEGANRMAGGDYSSHINIIRTDEIGKLALAFNQMADAIEKREHALMDLNQSLEARVMERTAALHLAKDEAEAILNNTSDAILLVNPEFAFTRANPAFLNLFGYREAELVGMTVDQLAEPDQRAAILGAVQQLSDAQKQTQVELRCRRQDGTIFAADAVFGLFGTRETSLHIICSFHDITSQKQAQQELQDALQKERELSAMKSGFVSLVSHEFRTPLAVIQSAGDLIEHYWERLTEKKRAEKMKEIRSQIGVMTNLLDNFLSVSGVETVGVDFAPAQLDLIAFARDLIAEMQQTLETDTIILSSQEASIHVSLDPKLLRQILVNLLTNAIKYSERDAPVEVEIVPAPDAISIYVRDQGMGIPVGDLPHIFNAFHRGTNIGNIHGTGLGLAIVKRAVEAHRGEVSLESVIGKGTIATVVLPTGSTQEGTWRLS